MHSARVRSISALAVACALAPATARAETRGEHVELSWSAPEGCPTERAALRAMDDAAAAAGTKRPRAPVRVRARVVREGEEARLVLAVGDGGEREIVAERCEALTASAAVVVAMSVREAASAEPAPVAPAEAALAPRDVASPAPREASATLRVRLEGLVDMGTLPAAAPGGGLALGVAGRHLSGEVAFGAFTSQRASAERDPSRGADFAMLAASARACWALGGRAVEISPCLGARIARVTGQGVGARRVEEGVGLAGGPEAGMSVRVPVSGPVALRGSADLTFPIEAQAFVITSLGTVHAPAPVTFQGAIGPEVSF